jgi:hypothetical protein
MNDKRCDAQSTGNSAAGGVVALIGLNGQHWKLAFIQYVSDEVVRDNRFQKFRVKLPEDFNPEITAGKTGRIFQEICQHFQLCPGSSDELAMLGLDPVPRRPPTLRGRRREKPKLESANPQSRYTLYRTGTKYRAGHPVCSGTIWSA